MNLTKQQLDMIRQIRIHDILDIKYTGRKVSIQCPSISHNDKSPSFLLDPENGYYCFGCGIKGKGAISFTMDCLGCSFNIACQELLSML